MVCGWPHYTITPKLSVLAYLISIIAYTIFKENSTGKYAEFSYANIDIPMRIKENIAYYMCIMKRFENYRMFERLAQNILSEEF